MKIVLELLDKNTGFFVKKIVLSVIDEHEMAAILSLSDFDLLSIYELDPDEVKNIENHFALNFGGLGNSGRLRCHYWFDDLPYLVHTNHELELMLAGTKPFASFSGEYPSNPDFEEIPDKKFDPYVMAGRLVKREFVELVSYGGDRGVRRVFYALPSEAWRIDAYILLLKTASLTGWNESLERLEGSLLGYQDWQNDAYINALRLRNGVAGVKNGNK